jgi:hypothetical protein
MVTFPVSINDSGHIAACGEAVLIWWVLQEAPVIILVHAAAAEALFIGDSVLRPRRSSNPAISCTRASNQHCVIRQTDPITQPAIQFRILTLQAFSMLLKRLIPALRKVSPHNQKRVQESGAEGCMIVRRIQELMEVTNAIRAESPTAESGRE